MNRSLLLSINSQQREVIPTRRNGCVCFIPIGKAQGQEEQNILSNCVRNCMVVSRELGGEPTLEECTMCCTDCIQSFDNPENCREACILGKGGPDVSIQKGEIMTRFINLLDVYHAYARDFLLFPRFAFISKFPSNLSNVILESTFVNAVWQYYRNILIEGRIIAFGVSHHIQGAEIPLVRFLYSGSLEFNQPRFNASFNRTSTAGSFIFLAIRHRGNGLLEILFNRCAEGITIKSILDAGGRPTYAEYFIQQINQVAPPAIPGVLDGEILERSVLYPFRLDPDIISIPQGISCNNTPDPPIISIERQMII